LPIFFPSVSLRSPRSLREKIFAHRRDPDGLQFRENGFAFFLSQITLERRLRLNPTESGPIPP
jgi:hypothetical protein